MIDCIMSACAALHSCLPCILYQQDAAGSRQQQQAPSRNLVINNQPQSSFLKYTAPATSTTFISLKNVLLIIIPMQSIIIAGVLLFGGGGGDGRASHHHPNFIYSSIKQQIIKRPQRARSQHQFDSSCHPEDINIIIRQPQQKRRISTRQANGSLCEDQAHSPISCTPCCDGIDYSQCHNGQRIECCCRISPPASPPGC